MHWTTGSRGIRRGPLLQMPVGPAPLSCEDSRPPTGSTVEARKLEHNCPHTLKVKYKGS